jgi:WD40 repeat protein
VLTVAFSPDGRTLATGSNDRTVLVWDVTDPAHPRRLGPPLAGHNEAVESVAFAPDGDTLAAASDDGTVLLWDLSDRTRPRRLGPPLTGWHVAFASDGHTLAIVGGLEAEVLLWDVTDRTHPRRLGPPLTVDGKSVSSVAFSPDGHTLAIASDDRTVLWDLSELDNLRGHVAELACTLTQGGLDRDEWVRYIPELPYQSSCPS